jgi:hypothetical protein
MSAHPVPSNSLGHGARWLFCLEDDMRWITVVAVALLVTVLSVFSLLRSGAQTAIAGPEGFASPINAGCYIAAEDVCKIHVYPFTININDGAGAKLEFFTLYANGKPIYDFRVDASNPPATDYSPSPVALDFAATCGVTYTVNLIAKDTTDANPLNYGQAQEIACPSEVP